MSELRLYRPANGSEGADFEENWCRRCIREQEWYAHDRNPCEIHNAVYFFDTDNPSYPKEWRYEGDRPVCTAFEIIPEPALAIVGSVSLAGHPKALEVIEAALDYFKPIRVVSGGAPGIDTMAKEAAERRGIPVTEHTPKVRRWLRGSPDGFEARNLLIAKDCTRLIRIAAADSTTYGSGWTRDQARRLRKPTHNIVVERADATRAEHT